MDTFEAWTTIQSAVLRSKDAHAIEAMRTLMRPPAQVPPGEMGVLGGSARQFAQQIHKTGENGEWATPPLHSQAMERLIHRLTCLLEAFLDVHEAARLRELAAAGRDMAEIVQWVNGPAVVDELYQPAYCDLCGAELSPDGSCNHCGN